MAEGTKFKTILMTEAVWRNSQLSVARFTGGIRLDTEDGKRAFLIVDKYGRDLTETSIPPGEPADLIDEKFIPLYKKLGREKFIDIIKDNHSKPRKEVKKALQLAADEKAAKEKAEKLAKKKAVEAQQAMLDFQ